MYASEEIYRQLWAKHKDRIQQGDIRIDPYIDNPEDDRRGLTLLYRPADTLWPQIQGFLAAAKNVAPTQYYYPQSDLHLTVLSIISCYPGFHYDQIVLADYLSMIRQSVQTIKSFDLLFEGVTAAADCIMIQGFDKSGRLNILRDRLRSYFKASELEHSIDKRYPIQTAHLTAIRFRQSLENPVLCSSLLEKNRKSFFGRCKVDKLELVYNDWYQRNSIVQKLAEFELERQ